MAIVTAHVAAVQQLYVAYFNRPADVAGLDYWTNIVAAQGSTAAVSATFATSPEYTEAFEGMTNEEIVDTIYQNLFGRAAEAGGKKYWADLLTAGTIKVDTIVAEVATAALTTDKEAVENKVAAATAFTNALDTPAEQAGYKGEEALALAKEFISDVTTDASLTAAIAPAALAATVAGVVAAGTPFTLASGLASLEAAQEGVADFLAGLDLDDDEDTDTTADDVEDAAEAALADVADLITVGTADPADAPANYLAASATVKAALLQDQLEANADALAAAQEELEEDQDAVAEVDGLAEAIEAMQDAADASEAAVEAAEDTQVEENVAVAAFAARNPDLGAITVVDGTITLADATELVVEEDGELVLGEDLDADDYPGIAALLTALNANFAAQAEVDQAARAELAATLEVALLDEGAGEADELATLAGLIDEDAVGEVEDGMPTVDQIITQLEILEEAGPSAELTAFTAAVDAYVAANTGANAATGNPLTNALLNETTGSQVAVEAAEEAIAALDEALAAVEEANANLEQLQALQAVEEAALDAFGDNDFKAPVTLGATAVGTAGSDIWLVGDEATTTISSFGRVGNDALFIGTDYTLNTGALSTGDNAKLEVFFIQSGTSVKVTLETEVYGSDTAAVAEQVITLTGVDADDLQLVNGIITLKGTAA